MLRRSAEDRIQDLEARAARLRADADRRLSVASDPTCALLWDCEKAVRALASYTGTDGQAKYGPIADSFAADRVVRWGVVRENATP